MDSPEQIKIENVAHQIANLQQAIDWIFRVEAAYNLGSVKRQSLYRIRCAIGDQINILRAELKSS